MGRKDDHPTLKAIGVYAADTAGNGNCLFHALAEQLYGDQSKHVQLRVAVIDYMNAHAGDFKSFIVVHPGGGQRRNPKRKNAGSFSAPLNAAAPTDVEVEATFQRYLKTMAQGGSYGDNMEIVAFASAFHVNVWIFGEQHGEFYTVAPPNEAGEVTRTLYIVHHAYEHYSSIRNTAGPHQGLPNVHIVQPSAQAEATMKAELASYSYVKEWMVEDALRSLPYETDRGTVEMALQATKGNVNEAVSNLLPASSQSSATSGTSSPASIERDHDDDYEMDQKPKKKQDRRQSRPHPLKTQHQLALRTKDGNMLSPDPNQLSAALSKLKDSKDIDPDETEEEDWQNESTFKDSESASVSTSVSDCSTNSKVEAAPIRLRLSQPKKQVTNARPVSTTSSEQSIAGEYDADAEKPQLERKIAKPRRRLITGNERRLAAEKAARLSNTALHTTTKKQNQGTPVIDMGIKVLSI